MRTPCFPTFASGLANKSGRRAFSSRKQIGSRQKLTVIVAGTDAVLSTPIAFASVTKYVYVVLFFTFVSVNVGVGGVPDVSVAILEKRARLATIWLLVKLPTARHTKYFRT